MSTLLRKKTFRPDYRWLSGRLTSGLRGQCLWGILPVDWPGYKFAFSVCNASEKTSVYLPNALLTFLVCHSVLLLTRGLIFFQISYNKEHGLLMEFPGFVMFPALCPERTVRWPSGNSVVGPLWGIEWCLLGWGCVLDKHPPQAALLLPQVEALRGRNGIDAFYYSLY
jgi:hypothetical protein